MAKEVPELASVLPSTLGIYTRLRWHGQAGTTMGDRDTGQLHCRGTMHNRRSEHTITAVRCSTDASPRRQDNQR